MPESSPTPLLKGVTVLDLSRILAGPWAGQLLGDLGARVIKVERPGRGDDTRQWGPPFTRNARGQEGDAAYFLCANRNKESIAIDFAQQRGAEIIRDLVKQADVLIENYKVGGLARYGLDYDSVKPLNPKLVYCSVSGFGQTGPYKDHPGYDFAIQAMGGLMSITGQPDGAPGAGPMKTGVAVADLFAGMYASSAILAALRYADQTGVGQHIDVSLFDCQVAMLANQAMNYSVSATPPGRLGNAHPNIVPYQTFQTADDAIVVAVGNNEQFVLFCEAIGALDLARDARFRLNRGRVERARELIPLLQERLLEHSASDWLHRLDQAEIPCAPINSIDQVFQDAHLKARGLTVSMAQHEGQEVTFVRHPVNYSHSPTVNNSPPPRLGQHTEKVLKDLLSYGRNFISTLKKQKIVG